MSNVDETITEFMAALDKAASRISGSYFRPERVGAKSETSRPWRERVYCYELYHQMRLILGNDRPLQFAGETDKSGHPNYYMGDNKAPDFIFHKPGSHGQNLVVIEVKTISQAKRTTKLNDALDSLATFSAGCWRYQRAILYIIGTQRSNDEDRLRCGVMKWRSNSSSSISDLCVLWHQNVGQPPISIAIP